MTKYRELWRVPGAPLLLLGGFVARVGQGITVLAWLLLVHETTGSYARAASVGAATSLAIALAAPIAGRLADRFGARRVLPWYGIAFASAQLGLLAVVLSDRSYTLVLVLAFVSGALFPPLSPALRAAWGRLTTSDSGRGALRTTAMAAESTLFELIFVIGPLLLSGFLLIAAAAPRIAGMEPGVIGPAAALTAAALCTGFGTVVIAAGRAMKGLAPQVTSLTRGLGPLTRRGVPSLLLCAVGVAISFGAAPVIIAAFAQSHDPASGGSVSGALIAVWSLGSAAAGLWYGTQELRWTLATQFVVLLAGLALSYLSWLVAPNPLVLGLLLIPGGAVIAPALTVQASLLAEVTPESMLNEVYTWLTTTNLAAAAFGSAATGLLIDRAGVGAGILGAAVAAALAAILAVRLVSVIPGAHAELAADAGTA